MEWPRWEIISTVLEAMMGQCVFRLVNDSVPGETPGSQCLTCTVAGPPTSCVTLMVFCTVWVAMTDPPLSTV